MRIYRRRIERRIIDNGWEAREGFGIVYVESVTQTIAGEHPR